MESNKLINEKVLVNTLLEINEVLKNFNIRERRIILTEMLNTNHLMEEEQGQDALFKAKQMTGGMN